jgi:hypothetical protein
MTTLYKPLPNGVVPVSSHVPSSVPSVVPSSSQQQQQRDQRLGERSPDVNIDERDAFGKCRATYRRGKLLGKVNWINFFF